MEDPAKAMSKSISRNRLALQVENVECMEEPANHIKFDFLGKDSIRYENQVEVDPRVWELVQQFCSKTGSGKGEPFD